VKNIVFRAGRLVINYYNARARRPRINILLQELAVSAKFSNSLPDNLRTIRSAETFKSSLKTHLYAQVVIEVGNILPVNFYRFRKFRKGNIVSLPKYLHNYRFIFGVVFCAFSWFKQLSLSHFSYCILMTFLNGDFSYVVRDQRSSTSNNNNNKTSVNNH